MKTTVGDVEADHMILVSHFTYPHLICFGNVSILVYILAFLTIFLNDLYKGLGSLVESSSQPN